MSGSFGELNCKIQVQIYLTDLRKILSFNKFSASSIEKFVQNLLEIRNVQEMFSLAFPLKHNP